MTVHLALSGGLDSTCLLALALTQHPGEVKAYSIRYGQRHRSAEQAAALRVTARYGIPLEMLDLTGLLHGSSLLGDGEVPHGHYAAETMAATVVQGRNLAFASALICQASPGDEVWLGVHGGDHFIYPDCRPLFIEPLDILSTTAYGVRVRAPFIDGDKADLLATGHSLGAPVELTWSCYEGGDLHCGRCGTCVERAEAFHLAGIPDPTEYADPSFWERAVAGADG